MADGLNRGFCYKGDAAHRLSIQRRIGVCYVVLNVPRPGAISLPGPLWSGTPVAGAGWGDCAASVIHLDLNFVEC